MVHVQQSPVGPWLFWEKLSCKEQDKREPGSLTEAEQVLGTEGWGLTKFTLTLGGGRQQRRLEPKPGKSE
jgi:hypothetical protein